MIAMQNESSSYFQWLIETSQIPEGKSYSSVLMRISGCVVPEKRVYLSDEDLIAAAKLSVVSAFHITEEVLESKGRARVAVFARCVAAYLLKKNTNLKLVEIGAALRQKGKGRFNHSTIIYMIGKATWLIESRDKLFCTRFNHAVSLFENITNIHVDTIDDLIEYDYPDKRYISTKQLLKAAVVKGLVIERVHNKSWYMIDNVGEKVLKLGENNWQCLRAIQAI